MADQNRHSWIRIGLIALPSDCTIVKEVQNVFPHFPNVLPMITRCHFPPDTDEITTETYQYSSQHLEDTARTIRPINDCSIIGLSCTSYSFAIGPEAINGILQRAHPESKVCNMAQTLLFGIDKFKMRNVLVMCPYEDVLYQTLQDFLAGADVNIVASTALKSSENTDFGIFSIPQKTIEDQLDELHAQNSEGVDGIVLCCSALYVLKPGFIDSLEAKYNVPVVTSMQAFLHHMIRSSGVNKKIAGFGRLFQEF